MKLLTKIKQWFKVKGHSLTKEVRMAEGKIEMAQDKHEHPQDEPQKSAALALFLKKYAPEATEDSFELVAMAELEGRGDGEVDLDNLTPEQEKHLCEVFSRVSKANMAEWIAGLCMSGYLDKVKEKLRRRTEARRAQEKREKSV